MATFLFQCPNTGFRVQGYSPDQKSDDENEYVIVNCHVCNRVHLVDPSTGKVVGGVEMIGDWAIEPIVAALQSPNLSAKTHKLFRPLTKYDHCLTKCLASRLI
jgi:hypothetical protein